MEKMICHNCKYESKCESEQLACKAFFKSIEEVREANPHGGYDKFPTKYFYRRSFGKTNKISLTYKLAIMEYLKNMVMDFDTAKGKLGMIYKEYNELMKVSPMDSRIHFGELKKRLFGSED
ncbi:MAG: hypothetical protein GY936_14230 [Ignavibacteriae bacterium]|nr:hypothetical protein [Ignavibacteriota bacterium]